MTTNFPAANHLTVSLLMASVLIVVKPGMAASVNFQVDAVIPYFLVQSNGKIVVPSEGTRINPDGSLDRGFRIAFNGRLQSATIQQGDKVLLGHSNGIDDFYLRPPLLQRFNADSSVDSSFHPNLKGAFQVIAGIVALDDGRLLVGGYTGLPTTQADPSFPPPRFKLLRLNSDGSPDNSFVAADVQASGARPAFALQRTGKIIVPTGAAPHLLRLNANGSKDNSFRPPDGYVVSNFLVESSGALIIDGAFADSSGRPLPGLARLLPEGGTDSQFHPPQTYVFDHAPLGLQMDGKILASVYKVDRGSYVLLRLLSDGTIDDSYNAAVPYGVASIVPENNGSVLISGSFQEVQGNAQTGIARLKANGAVDPAFSPIFTRPGTVLTLAAQGDKIIAGGDFTRVDGPFVGSVVRLTSDGALDPSFQTSVIAGKTFHAEVQRDGKIVVANDVVAIGASHYTGLVRLNIEGSLDPTFSASNATIFRAFTLQAAAGGDKILGVTEDAIFRVNPDGSSDSTFVTNQYRSTINGLKVQSDGRILEYGVGRTGVLNRLYGDGTTDPSFTDPQANKAIDAVAVQDDGKIVVGGDFQFFGDNTTYFSELLARPYLARLQPDGRVDETFNVSVNSTVSSLLVQKSGQIVIGGTFTSVNNYPVAGVARLNPPDFSLDPSLQVTTQGGAVTSIVELSNGTVAVAGEFGVVTSIVSPLQGQLVPTDTDIPFATLVVIPATTPIAEVRFLVDGNIIDIVKDPLAFRSAQPIFRDGVHGLSDTVGPNIGVYSTKNLNLPSIGTYSLTVQVVDSYGNVSTSSVSTVTATNPLLLPPPPTYSIDSLLSGAVLPSNQPITVSASLTVQRGSPLAKVALYVNGLKVQELKAASSIATRYKAASAPYTFTFVPPAPGAYALVIVATATNGSTVSSPVIGVTAAPPPSPLANISTRLFVDTADNVLIGGFIITGSVPKRVMLRAIAPSLPFAGALADPTLELHFPDGSARSNDNWKINDQTGLSQEAEIRATTIPPQSDLESALVQTLAPGSYTAILRGRNGGTGIGLVEAYDLDQTSPSRLANISTRGFVDTGDNVMIGGFILGPSSSGGARVLVRAIGPALTLPGALTDPTLELRNGNGDRIAANDNWKINDSSGQSQEGEIRTTTIPPSNDLESAILTTLPAGNYTAIVAGKNGGAGVGLVEVYGLP